MSINLNLVAIYILELEENKYYIGRSKKKTDAGIRNRIKQHFNQRSTAAAWCKKYQPIKIVKILKDQTTYDENKWTKIYMEKHGIENVRGGDYVRIKLPKDQIKSLQREIDGANDKCHGCGKSGHFIGSCKNKKIKKEPIEKYEEEIVWECGICLKQYATEKECENCEIKHKNNKVLNNLQRRFKNIKYGEIIRLCEKYYYHGGLVSREIRTGII